MQALIISGSLRKDSYNTSVARTIESILKAKNINAYVLSAQELDVPLYNSDISLDQFPQGVTRLKHAVESADMLVFVIPEYNHSVPGGLKNAIDWLSGGEHNSLDRKIAAITGVSTGVYGTLRAQHHMREILAALNVYIVSLPEVYIGPAVKLFNEHNELVDEKTIEKINLLLDATIQLTEKLT